LTHWLTSHILSAAPCSGAVRYGQAQSRGPTRPAVIRRVGQANPVHPVRPPDGLPV